MIRLSLVLSFYDVDEDIGRHREGVVLVNFKEPTKSTGGGASRLAKLTTDQDQTKEVDYLLECDDAIDEYATRESAEFDSQRRDDESLLPGFLTARNDDDGDESAKKSESNEMEEALREFFAKERKHPKVVARRLASTVCKAMTRSSNLAKSIDTFGLPPVEVNSSQSLCFLLLRRLHALFSLGSAQPESHQKRAENFRLRRSAFADNRSGLSVRFLC